MGDGDQDQEQEQNEELPAPGMEPEAEDESGVRLDRSQLPPELQDVPEEQLPGTLSTLTTVLKERNKQLEELQQNAPAGAGNSGQGRQPTAEEVREEVEDLDDEELEDLMYENPEKAIDHVIRKRYGKTLQELDQRTRSSYETSAMIQARQQFDDFEEYEDDVQQILESTGTPATPENVQGAYVYAVGQEALRKRQQEHERNRKRDPSIQSEAPDKGEQEDTGPELTSTEKSVAHRLGMDEEEYAQFRDTESIEVDVPTG